MFGMGTSRENVKKINKIVDDTGIEQLKLNIFILMRDIAFYSEDGGYIKDISMLNSIGYGGNTKEEINELFYKCCSKNSIDFIKELITPEITESRFVSKEQLEFLRDIYSTDGSQLKPFHDLTKKYGKNFDGRHTNSISNLKHIFSFKNDLFYLEKYLNDYLSDYEEKHDYNSLFSYILYDNDRVRESFKKAGLLTYEELYPTVKEAVDIIFNDNIDDITDEEKKEIALSIKKHQNELLLFFLCKEFIPTNISSYDGEVYGELPLDFIVELPKGEYIKTYYSNVIKLAEIDLYPNDVIIDNKLNLIIQSDLSEFVQSINEEYGINITPTDEMVAEFNKFKNYYNHFKLLEQKNNLLYEKYKSTNKNKFNLIYDEEQRVKQLYKKYTTNYKEEQTLNENDVTLFDFCMECNDVVNNAFGSSKKRI